MERIKKRCGYCGKYNATHRDHIIPRCQNGSHNPENLVWACPPCNMRKNGRTPEEAGMTLTMHEDSVVSKSYYKKRTRKFVYPYTKYQTYIKFDELEADYPELAKQYKDHHKRYHNPKSVFDLLWPFDWSEWKILREYEETIAIEIEGGYIEKDVR